MFKGLLSILLFLFCLFILFLMLTGSFILRTIRRMRKAVQDAAEQQESRFRTETGRQRRQYTQRAQNTQRPQATQVETGETIIDHRHQQRENRKIFDDTDGEYVDFIEEK